MGARDQRALQGVNRGNKDLFQCAINKYSCISTAECDVREGTPVVCSLKIAPLQRLLPLGFARKVRLTSQKTKDNFA